MAGISEGRPIHELRAVEVIVSSVSSPSLIGVCASGDHGPVPRPVWTSERLETDMVQRES